MKKELYLPYFENKKVTIMGLGLLGRGIGDTAFLAKAGAHVLVTDKKTKEELATSLDALKEYPSIEFHLGAHELSDFENRDFILKAAGVPLDSEYIKHAKEQHIPVYMSAAFVVQIVKEKLEGVNVIGVTGTRGKSTASHLIHHILKEAGRRVHMGGNVRGIANLPLLEEIEAGDSFVLELDSWQLQGFSDLSLSPNIAVFTSFLDDHLNYYSGDKELYFNDKASIFINQKPDDVLIGSAQAAEEIRKRFPEIDIVIPEAKTYDALLIGEHNDILISLAYEACKKCGLTDAEIENGIKTFKPVAGRLENIGEYKGVTVYNDNNATTPDATVVGIDAIMRKHGKKPILICGGSDKNLSLVTLEQSIQEKTKAVVLLAGTGTEKLNANKENLCERLEDCVRRAFELAEEGDVILFSPGFASFSNYFKNEYERNDAFVTLVATYK